MHRSRRIGLATAALLFAAAALSGGLRCWWAAGSSTATDQTADGGTP